jgi:A/G-specific adenine glycosylase
VFHPKYPALRSRGDWLYLAVVTLPQPKAAAIVPKLLKWFSEKARDLPWRRTRDPYAIWVSEIMLQQTQVRTVVPYWNRWLGELPTLAALARARPERIHKLWEGLGYYTRVRNMQKAAQTVVREHGGRFPERFEEVLALPGIGRYTAGAICSIAFNQPHPVLDGNVVRVLTRVYGIDRDPREKETKDRLWRLAGELVETADRLGRGARPRPSRATRPPGGESCSQLNQSLMELGATICLPREPRCAECPLKAECVAAREGRVAELPALGRRATVTARRFVAFVVRKGDRLLVRQRPAGGVNAHLWEFPNAETRPDRPDLEQAAREALGAVPAKLEPLGTLKHSITRYRITLEAYAAGGSAAAGANGRWVDRRAAGRLAFASAHKKILDRIRRG